MQPDQNSNRLYDFHTERGKGILATALFHAVLISLLVFAGLTASQPKTEEGLLVNFGTDDFGSGMIEPSQSSAAEASPQPEPQATAASPVQEKQIDTQEHDEEAPEIKKTVQQSDPEAERKKLEAIEAEKKRLADLETERLRKLQEEAERKRIEEEARKTQQALDRTRNALAAGKATGTTSTGEGTKTGTGNQGVTTGSVTSTVRGEGSGLGTGGPGFSLEGRNALSLPLPLLDYKEDGIVVVEVTVDRNGKVTSAVAGVKGSNTLNDDMLKAAKDAAMLAKFDVKNDAPLTQKGTITYFFILK